MSEEKNDLRMQETMINKVPRIVWIVIGVLSIGGLVGLVFMLGVLKAAYITFRNMDEAQEEFISIEKGELAIGSSSGVQTISDPLERHFYQFHGNAGQELKFELVQYSPTYGILWIYMPGRDRELVKAFADAMGLQRGDTLTVTATLPITGSYEILVDMNGDDIGDYELKITAIP